MITDMDPKRSRTPVVVWNPNPTLDVVSTVAKLRIGAVHRASQQTVAAGGKGTLVLRGLRILGVKALGVAPLAGDVGSVVRQLVIDEGLPMEMHEVDGQTRVALTVVDAEGNDTNINGPGPYATGERWGAHIEAVSRLVADRHPHYLVLAGRPPLDCDPGDIRRLLEEAAALGVRTVIDLASPLIEHALPVHPWLVKINTDEAIQATGVSDTGHGLVDHVLLAGAHNVLLTAGPDRVIGKLDGLALEAIPPRVSLQSAVGCGDAFLAGFISVLAQDDRASAEAAVRMAIGAGSASAEDLRPGHFRLNHANALASRVDFGPAWRCGHPLQQEVRKHQP